MNKSRVTPQTLLMIVAGIAMAWPNNLCLGQADDAKENDVGQLQILLRTDGLDVVSPERKGGFPEFVKDQMLPPGVRTLRDKSAIRRQKTLQAIESTGDHEELDTKYFREQLSQQIEFLANQGNDVQKLRELVERLQLALEVAEKETTSDVAVAVFAVPAEPQQRPEENPQPTPPNFERPIVGFGYPGFAPHTMMPQNHILQHRGQEPQNHRPEFRLPGIDRPEIHQPGPFAEDLNRITALKESAERLAQAGLPDVAHGLREQAGQVEREMAEKQERMKREERERAQVQTRAGNEHADRSVMPMRELHQQMQQLQREMHKVSERLGHLTEMIERLHDSHGDRYRHHQDIDDDDDDDHEENDHDDKDRDDHNDEDKE